MAKEFNPPRSYWGKAPVPADTTRERLAHKLAGSGDYSAVAYRRSGKGEVLTLSYGGLLQARKDGCKFPPVVPPGYALLVWAGGKLAGQAEAVNAAKEQE